MQTFCGGSTLRYACQKLTGKSAFKCTSLSSVTKRSS